MLNGRDEDMRCTPNIMKECFSIHPDDYLENALKIGRNLPRPRQDLPVE